MVMRLQCVTTGYPRPEDDNRPLMSISAWTQYVLDSFETVEEAVTELRKETFRPVSVIAPNGVEGKIHLSISDPSGDSAIFEYINGKQVIHHGKSIVGGDQTDRFASSGPFVFLAPK
jgi:penicillin V acylase-like amidase (Ntn superfamily)